MRELLEPEVSAEIAEAQDFLVMWKSVTVKPMTTREVDFAKLVRKQAYEDGMRDAGITFPQINDAAKMLAERMDYPWSQMPQQGRDKMREIAQAVIEAAMLTASKKEPQ